MKKVGFYFVQKGQKGSKMVQNGPKVFIMLDMLNWTTN